MARYTTKAIRLYAEDTFNTKPASPLNLILSPMTTFGIKEEYDTEDIETITGDGEASPMQFGRSKSAGDLGFKLTGEIMPVIANFLIGEATSVPATTDMWTSTATVVAGDIVNHSDGLHSLYCSKGGTTDITEPTILDEYDSFVDGTVTWITRDTLYRHTGVRSSCLPTFGIEVELEDGACTGGGEGIVFFRYEGCYMGTGNFGKTGSDTTFESTVSVMASSATNSINPTSGTYDPQSGSDEVFNKEFFTQCHLDITIDGITATNTKEFTLDVDRQLEQEPLIDCSDLINIGIIKLSGNANVLFEKAYYERGIEQTSHEVVLTYSSKGDVAQFTLPDVRFSKTSPTVEVGKFNTLEATHSASGDAATPSISYDIVSSLAVI